MTIAVIFLPNGLDDLATSRCLTYCSERGYEVAGVILGDWEAAARMLCNRVAGVLVVDRPDHLAGDREPRIEVVAAEQSTRSRHPRTRVIRRDAAT